MQKPKFNWETFIEMIDSMSYDNPEVQFSKLEKVFLKCYWYGMNEREILRVLEVNRSELNHYYNDCYFRWGFQPDVMKKLSNLIGEPVNKKNFKEICRRRWEEDNKQI